MKKTTFGIIVAIVVLSAVLYVAGCSKDDNATAPTVDTELRILRVTPADGSTGVSEDAPITIKFSGPVSTSTITHNFYFAGGEMMHEWRDSLDNYGGFGMMGMGHMDHMMDWMDSIEIAGEFHWNDVMDSCEFVPDSALHPNTDYLCLLYESGMRGPHGGMMGGGDHGDSGYHMYQFTIQPRAIGAP
jgi:hypothetical protein